MNEKKQKRLELQIKQIYWTDWETKKRFKSIHFNEAVQSCDALAKKYGPAYSVRLFDVFTKERAYPYQKDKTGKEIKPNFL